MSARDIVAKARRLLAKATPGPWVVWKGHAEVFAGPVDENSPGAVRGFRGKICECEDLDWGEAQDRDNARLIAAAPSLLRGFIEEVERLRAENDLLKRHWPEEREATICEGPNGWFFRGAVLGLRPTKAGAVDMAIAHLSAAPDRGEGPAASAIAEEGTADGE